MEEKKQPQEEPQYNALETVYIAKDNMEAEIVISILDANSIKAYKSYDASGDYMNLYMGASMQGVNILVANEALESAKDIVADIQLESHSDEAYAQADYDREEWPEDIDIEDEMKQVEEVYGKRKKAIRIIIVASLVVTFLLIILYEVTAKGNLI